MVLWRRQFQWGRFRTRVFDMLLCLLDIGRLNKVMGNNGGLGSHRERLLDPRPRRGHCRRRSRPLLCEWVHLWSCWRQMGMGRESVHGENILWRRSLHSNGMNGLQGVRWERPGSVVKVNWAHLERQHGLGRSLV